MNRRIYKRKTKVVNLRISRHDIYIGRGSKWGNPFVIGRDGNREEVIRKYREWILGRTPSPNHSLPPSIDDIRTELMGQRLGCYCKPQACHGDVLVEIAEGRLG
ncbi:MAG: DUF4326 domain-containing protein [Planctomycetes bacterium]|nr:DUF4326 domain-containing protein [Planctomycetota bacterium]